MGQILDAKPEFKLRLLNLEPRSYPHMVLPPRSPEDKRCHPGGTQYCILIEKSAQSQPHSARSKNANRKIYSTMVAFYLKKNNFNFIWGYSWLTML